MGGENLIYLCGIYKVIGWKYRFAILTRDANASMIKTHDRMPIIVNKDAVRCYLTDWGAAMELIALALPELRCQSA